MRRVGATLGEFGDFLRLGLLLILDRNPDEATARAKFLEVREITRDRLRPFYRTVFDDLTADEIEQLTTLTLVPSFRKGRGLVDAPGRRVMGAKAIPPKAIRHLKRLWERCIATRGR